MSGSASAILRVNFRLYIPLNDGYRTRTYTYIHKVHTVVVSWKPDVALALSLLTGPDPCKGAINVTRRLSWLDGANARLVSSSQYDRS